MENLMKYTDLYFDKFSSVFPMEQALGTDDEIIDQIKNCLSKNKRAEELYPNEYGSLDGELI